MKHNEANGENNCDGSAANLSWNCGFEGPLVKAWRITSKAYSTQADAFSGFGAAHYPGRWNRLGVPVVYCCSSIALCALEALVHTKSTQTLETKFVTFEVRIPADITFPPHPPKDLRKLEQRREIGQQWIKDGQFAVMRVRASSPVNPITS